MSQIGKRKYANPPIQEAVCEIHFEHPYARTKEDLEPFKVLWADGYPNQKVVEERTFQFHVSPDGVTTDDKTGGNRLICRSSNDQRLVQLNDRFLVVNQLAPYPGWEEGFRDMILKQVDHFKGVSGSFNMHRIGLRYIDRINIPEQPATWNEWLNIELPVPTVPGARPNEFQTRIQSQLSEGLRLVMNIVTLPPETTPPTSPIILDFDVIWEGDAVAIAGLADILEKVHIPLGLAFEGYLTDKVRKLFD